MATTMKSRKIRSPRVKDGFYHVYVSEENKHIIKKLDILNTLLVDEHVTGVASGSDLINRWVDEKFDELMSKILKEKKVKAPVFDESLTIKREDVKLSATNDTLQINTSETEIKRLLANEFYSPIPRLDEYNEKMIEGKSVSQALKEGIISAETAADIYTSVAMAYHDMTNDRRVMSALGYLDSKNDTRKKPNRRMFKTLVLKKLKKDDVRGRFTTTASIMTSSFDIPPDYNEDDYEDVVIESLNNKVD